MRRSDDKSSTAHKIASSAEDLGLRSWVAGDLSAVLQVASKAEQDSALNLGNYSGIKLLDGVIHHGSPLTVTSSNDLGVWALGVSEVEEGGGSANGSWRRVLWQKVVGKSGIVWRADALAGNLGGAEDGLEGSAGLGANDGALFFLVNIYLFPSFFGLVKGGRVGICRKKGHKPCSQTQWSRVQR